MHYMRRRSEDTHQQYGAVDQLLQWPYTALARSSLTSFPRVTLSSCMPTRSLQGKDGVEEGANAWRAMIRSD